MWEFQYKKIAPNTYFLSQINEKENIYQRLVLLIREKLSIYNAFKIILRLKTEFVKLTIPIFLK